MAVVVSVRFKEVGKNYHFDPCGKEYKCRDKVIVETARGVECGTVTIANREIPDEEITAALKPVLRLANPNDLKTVEENKLKEKEAFDICLGKIADHKLDMHLVDVEYTFDGNKILFYFTADGRVDFRELVKDLASLFRTRIELRQIGVRDETKMGGGIGICGRPYCCSTFLTDFAPVSIKMAKDQNLSLNPTKISGTCGRLMCCLKYEESTYEDLTKNLPDEGDVVDTPSGTGEVLHVNVLRQLVKVGITQEKGDVVITEFPLDEIKINKKRRRRNNSEYMDKEEQKQLRELEKEF